MTPKQDDVIIDSQSKHVNKNATVCYYNGCKDMQSTVKLKQIEHLYVNFTVGGISPVTVWCWAYFWIAHFAQNWIREFFVELRRLCTLQCKEEPLIECPNYQYTCTLTENKTHCSNWLTSVCFVYFVSILVITLFL